MIVLSCFSRVCFDSWSASQGAQPRQRWQSMAVPLFLPLKPLPCTPAYRWAIRSAYRPATLG